MKKIIESKFVEILVILGVLVLGFGARLYKINSPIADWHSWRQVDTASVSRIYMEEGIDLLNPRYYDISRIQTGIFNPVGWRLVEFPMYNALHSFLASTFGLIGFNVWGRIISIISSLVSVFTLYLIGKRFYGKWVGLVTAGIFAFMPYNIYFSRVILPEPMSVALAMVSIYLFAWALEKEKTALLMISGVCFALATLIKPFVFFYGFALLYLAVKKYGFKNLFTNKRMLIFANIAINPFFLWRIYVNQFPQGIPHFSWAFNGDEIRFRPAFWRWIFAERIGVLMLGVWGLVPLVLGILRSAKKSLVANYLMFGMLMYVSIIATANVRHDYYQVYLVPVVALLTAVGLVHLWNFEGKWIGKVLAVFAVFMMMNVGYMEVKGFYQINHPEIIVAGNRADEILPRDAIVIAPYLGDTAFLYQTKRYGFPVVDERIEEMVERGATHYVSVNYDNDTNYVMANYEVLESTDAYLIADLRERQVK